MQQKNSGFKLKFQKSQILLQDDLKLKSLSVFLCIRDNNSTNKIELNSPWVILK